MNDRFLAAIIQGFVIVMFFSVVLNQIKDIDYFTIVLIIVFICQQLLIL